MRDDWDVIEELEFWDDYNEIYGPQPPTRRQLKKMAKAKKRQEKEAARKPATNPGDGVGCGTLLIITIIIILLVAFKLI